MESSARQAAYKVHQYAQREDRHDPLYRKRAQATYQAFLTPGLAACLFHNLLYKKDFKAGKNFCLYLDRYNSSTF